MKIDPNFQFTYTPAEEPKKKPAVWRDKSLSPHFRLAHLYFHIAQLNHKACQCENERTGAGWDCGEDPIMKGPTWYGDKHDVFALSDEAALDQLRAMQVQGYELDQAQQRLAECLTLPVPEPEGDLTPQAPAPAPSVPTETRPGRGAGTPLLIGLTAAVGVVGLTAFLLRD